MHESTHNKRGRARRENLARNSAILDRLGEGRGSGRPARRWQGHQVVERPRHTRTSRCQGSHLPQGSGAKAEAEGTWSLNSRKGYADEDDSFQARAETWGTASLCLSRERRRSRTL